MAMPLQGLRHPWDGHGHGDHGHGGGHGHGDHHLPGEVVWGRHSPNGPIVPMNLDHDHEEDDE